MKMAMISYNSAIDSEIMDALAECGVENYTKWTRVQGKGGTSGSHFGSEIWPGENSVILSAAEDKVIKDLLGLIRELRKKLGKEGVKAFIWPIEEIT